MSLKRSFYKMFIKKKIKLLRQWKLSPGRGDKHNTYRIYRYTKSILQLYDSKHLGRSTYTYIESGENHTWESVILELSSSSVIITPEFAFSRTTCTELSSSSTWVISTTSVMGVLRSSCSARGREQQLMQK